MSADRLPSLEDDLRALALRIDHPATPDLAAAVAQRLREGGGLRASGIHGGRRTRWWLQPRVATLAAAVVAVLALTLLASPAAREAVASIFRGVRGIRVVVDEGRNSSQAPLSELPAPASTPPAPDPPAADPPAPLPASAAPSVATSIAKPLPPPTISATPLAVAAKAPAIPGRRTTLAAALNSLPFTPLLPPELGPPDRVHLEQDVAGGMLTLVWSARPGLPPAAGEVGAVLTEFKPDFGDDFPYWLKSGVTTSALLDVEVNGSGGHWIEGGHRLDFNIPDNAGWQKVASSRIAANTLIWVQDGVTMRLESALPLDAALRLAAFIR